VYEPHTTTFKVTNGLFIKLKELILSGTMNKILFK